MRYFICFGLNNYNLKVISFVSIDCEKRIEYSGKSHPKDHEYHLDDVNNLISLLEKGVFSVIEKYKPFVIRFNDDLLFNNLINTRSDLIQGKHINDVLKNLNLVEYMI